MNLDSIHGIVYSCCGANLNFLFPLDGFKDNFETNYTPLNFKKGYPITSKKVSWICVPNCVLEDIKPIIEKEYQILETFKGILENKIYEKNLDYTIFIALNKDNKTQKGRFHPLSKVPKKYLKIVTNLKENTKKDSLNCLTKQIIIHKRMENFAANAKMETYFPNITGFNNLSNTQAIINKTKGNLINSVGIISNNQIESIPKNLRNLFWELWTPILSFENHIYEDKHECVLIQMQKTPEKIEEIIKEFSNEK